MQNVKLLCFAEFCMMLCDIFILGGLALEPRNFYLFCYYYVFFSSFLRLSPFNNNICAFLCDSFFFCLKTF